jgi:FimV-like protein
MTSGAFRVALGLAVLSLGIDSSRAQQSAHPDRYIVKPGDTLGKIARANLPSGVSRDQMLVALQKANPRAFIRGNINLLRSGVAISIPNEESAKAVDAALARRLVREQTEQYATGRARPTVAVAAAKTPQSSPVQQSTTSSGDPKAVKDAGPYVPSPQSVVADMLKLANVGAKDFVIDLGSGDGRIVLTAAKVFGASGFGVEIKDDLVKESNEAAKIQGVSDRVKFITQDLFKTDISKATVLTMYLLPNTVNMLKDKLLTELRPGTRILSHDYPLTGWVPEKYVQMDLEDKVAISGVSTTLIYLYLVPAKLEPAWTANVPAAVSKDPVRLNLKQAITRVSGMARIGAKDVVVEDGIVRGDKVSFRLLANGRSFEFEGSVKGPKMEGTVQGAGTKAAWSATLDK